MIYHYLLTRFNLALWIEDKNGAAIDREEWLKRRMALFEILLSAKWTLVLDFAVICHV